MNNIEFKSTFDEIEYDIAMKMYMEHNDKIASINEHLGEMYSYKDLEEAKALEEYDTLQEYKKALREKCDAFDKVMEYIEKNTEYLDIEKGEVFPCMGAKSNRVPIISVSGLSNILGGEDNDNYKI